MRLANVKNINAKKTKADNTRLERQQLIISDSLVGYIVVVVSYSCLPKLPPPEFHPWLDLDAACIHHCIA